MKNFNSGRRQTLPAVLLDTSEPSLLSTNSCSISSVVSLLESGSLSSIPASPSSSPKRHLKFHTLNEKGNTLDPQKNPQKVDEESEKDSKDVTNFCNKDGDVSFERNFP